ncbi:hypothetical protein A5746_12580 [Mycolicibacterium conceptionense]|nr:hypothetical protein A5639_14175 [Mycolicibacterium conceptionense]OMB87432.1 hypothetical protein A5741_15945 [Mycolicibacterium conceptionense]OMC00209.1 hypothetical protein A5746_12580 [Mycolicibacterium conceptionense]
MDALMLSYSDTRRLVDMVGMDVMMRTCIARLRCGLSEMARENWRGCPPRNGFVHDHNVGGGVIENMPYLEVNRGMTLKTISYKPNNNANHRLPTVVGAICRYSDSSGELIAICDATVPTAIRTGAASAVASSILARPDSRTAAIVGAGLQAVTQIHALSVAFTLDRIQVYDIDRRCAESLKDRCNFTSAQFEVFDDPHEVVKGADILVTATSVRPGAGPVVRDERLASHLHINSIGSDEPGKTELPLSVLNRAYICVDHMEQALSEGECQVLERDEIDVTLQDLVGISGSIGGPLPQVEDLTVFDSTGFAFEDHVALDVFLDFAAEAGIGDKFSILDGPVGLHSPYATSRTE